MIHDIKELDDIAHRMGVMWDKANNFYVSFTGDLLAVKTALESGRYGSDWTLAKWLFIKAGMFQKPIFTVLKAHQNSMAEEHREKLALADRDRQLVVREDKVAEKRAARLTAAQARVVASQQRLEIAQAEQKARELERDIRIAQKAALAAVKEPSRRRKPKPKPNRRKPAVKAKIAVAVSTEVNPRLAALLVECSYFEKDNRTALGRRYVEMKDIVTNKKQAGIDPSTGNRWFWEAWCKAHIEGRGPRDIRKCMEAYRRNGRFSENVVAFGGGR